MQFLLEIRPWSNVNKSKHTNIEAMRITYLWNIFIRLYVRMAVIYDYLERDNDNVFKFHKNITLLFFETSV